LHQLPIRFTDFSTQAIELSEIVERGFDRCRRSRDAL